MVLCLLNDLTRTAFVSSAAIRHVISSAYIMPHLSPAQLLCRINKRKVPHTRSSRQPPRERAISAPYTTFFNNKNSIWFIPTNHDNSLFPENVGMRAKMQPDGLNCCPRAHKRSSLLNALRQICTHYILYVSVYVTHTLCYVNFASCKYAGSEPRDRNTLFF